MPLVPELLLVPAALGAVEVELPEEPMPDRVAEPEDALGAVVAGAAEPLIEPPADPIPEAVPDADPVPAQATSAAALATLARARRSFDMIDSQLK